MLYDLHTHSTCSDGRLSPVQLVQLARKNGVSVLALTDHDTLEGIDAAKEEAGNHLTLVPGIELSALWKGLNIHIVGLQVAVDSVALQEAVGRQCQIRQQRAVTIAERLARVGIRDALEGARQYASGASIGRPHFAQYLVDANYVDSFSGAFKKYLGTARVGDVNHQWPAIEEVVSWIDRAGGIAVLAHPDKYKLTRTRLYKLLDYFVSAGGRAMEVVSGHQQARVTDKLARAAGHYSLLASCGSDFHSTDNGWQSPGKMTPLPQQCRPVWEAW